MFKLKVTKALHEVILYRIRSGRYFRDIFDDGDDSFFWIYCAQFKPAYFELEPAEESQVMIIESEEVFAGISMKPTTKKYSNIPDYYNQIWLGRNLEGLYKMYLIQEFIDNGHITGHPICFNGSVAFESWLETKPKEEEEEISDTPDGTGWVYIFRYDRETGVIHKIGKTANLLRRIQQLKPDTIVNVCRCDNYHKLEKLIQNEFEDQSLPQSEHFTINNAQVKKAQKFMFKYAEGGYT